MSVATWLGCTRNMAKFKYILMLCVLTFVWLMLWGYSYEIAKLLYSSNFAHAHLNPVIYECFPVNIFRIMAYVSLFYGQLVIFKATASSRQPLVDYFKMPISFNGIKANLLLLKGLGNQSISKNLKLVLKNLVWIFYWANLSLMLYWVTSSHFMGDCDDGDLECTCNNIQYLFPVFIVTLLVGCLYVTVSSYKKNKGNA